MSDSILTDSFFSRLETLSLNLKSNLTGYFGGKHLVNTYGQTVEFADFREYQLGDDIRRIDWNLYSRFEKYFLKLFTDERQMQVQIFVDVSASMGKDDKEKREYTIKTAAALGFLAVQSMDRLAFYIMNGEKAENPFGTIVGKNSFFRAMKELEKTEFVDDCNIESCITNCSETGTNNGLTVIISDFFTENDWKKAIDYLVYKKRQVLLVQVLSPAELDPVYDGRIHLIDSESGDIEDNKNMKLKINRAMQKAYVEALNDYLEEINSFCKKRGVGYFHVNTENPIEKELFGDLLVGGIMV